MATERAGCEDWRLQVPVVMQGPVGPAATSEIVVAVSRAGGLGCLAASWTPPAVLRSQVREIRRLSDRPFCVNLVLAFDQAERLELLIEERVPAISFSWGVDEGAFRRARAAGGAMVLAQVGGRLDAQRAASAGADVLIAQGTEAGGHVQSRSPLQRVLRDVRDAVPLPVLAAGGIADASSAAAALDAGASGIVAGTAYLAADEADVHPVYRERVFDARASDTCLTTLFDVGWPNAQHRVLRNDTFERWQAAGSPPAGQRPGEHEPIACRGGRPIVRYSDAQPTETMTGDIAAMALYAGTGVDRIQRKEEAAAITERLVAAASRGRPRPPGLSL